MSKIVGPIAFFVAISVSAWDPDQGTVESGPKFMGTPRPEETQWNDMFPETFETSMTMPSSSVVDDQEPTMTQLQRRLLGDDKDKDKDKYHYIKEGIVLLNVGDDYVKFEDIDYGKKTQISGHITGLSPGKHGWHIHQLGDLFTDGCTSFGPHYNPFNNNHGAPNDKIRHIGDLGNIYADDDGVAYIEDLYDDIIKLNGPNSIIGRGFVIHSDEDDLGKGGNDDSLQTGNAGDRIKCGVIGIKKED